MPMKMNSGAAWACAGAAAILAAAGLYTALKRLGKFRPRLCWTLLLPGILGLGLARAGFELLQWDEPYAAFRWCYTMGFFGMTLGAAVAARAADASAAETLDGCAAAFCLAMAVGRLAQRWLGEAGMGPILDEGGWFTMLNDWDEPVLSAWLVETICCLAAAGATLAAGRRKPALPGGTFCLAVFFLMAPSVLTEQFRSGAYLRFMMMRLEQALYALGMLHALFWLGRRIGRLNPSAGIRAYAPCGIFLILCGGIALIQFILDGKIASWPPALCWALYGGMIAGMLGLGIWTCRRADQALEKGA